MTPEEILNLLEETALAGLKDPELRPNHRQGWAKVLLDLVKFRMDQGDVSEEDLSKLLEKIPGKAAKKFRRLLEGDGE